MHTTTIGRCAAAAALLGLGALSAAPAQAAFPGDDGPLIFFSGRSLLTLDAAGGRPRQLPLDVPGFGGLAVSADGLRIAYADSHELHVADADGSGERQLTEASDGYADDPSLSPDGKRIAFVRDHAIWVIGVAGGAARELTPDGSFEHAYSEPAWSPDGRRIAYTRDEQVWTMNADGSGQTDLTPAIGICPRTVRTMRGGEPSWSPDGRRLAFTGPVPCEDSRGRDIWTMNADGSGKVDLTRDDGTDDTGPVFSPDGRSIAFERPVDGHPHLHVMGADGSGLHRVPVATGLYAEMGVEWSVAVTPVRIVQRLRARTVRAGRAIVVTGTVRPAVRGTVTVRFSGPGGRSWRVRAALSRGRFRCRFAPRRPGRYRVVATLPAAPRRPAAASAPGRLRVVR